MYRGSSYRPCPSELPDVFIEFLLQHASNAHMERFFQSPRPQRHRLLRFFNQGNHLAVFVRVPVDGSNPDLCRCITYFIQVCIKYSKTYQKIADFKVSKW